MRKILYNLVTRSYPMFLRFVYKMEIGKNTIISHRAVLDRSINPKGIHIGDNCWVLRNAIILAHDHCRNIKIDTYIGNNSVIGINSIILPGIKIGSHVVVGAGSVVTKDVEDNCIVAGNPARVIRERIKLNNKGQIIS